MTKEQEIAICASCVLDIRACDHPITYGCPLVEPKPFRSQSGAAKQERATVRLKSSLPIYQAKNPAQQATANAAMAVYREEKRRAEVAYSDRLFNTPEGLRVLCVKCLAKKPDADFAKVKSGKCASYCRLCHSQSAQESNARKREQKRNQKGARFQQIYEVAPAGVRFEIV